MADTESEIRDMFSTTMKQMGRELDAMNKKALELGNSGSSSFEKFKRQNDALNEANKRTSGSLTAMGSVLTGISKSLIGPVGVVAGFAAFQKALEGVSESTIQLKNFSTNSGFATSSIQDMQQAMRRMGLSTQEADSSIATLGNKLNNLRAFKEGSDVFQALSKAVGGVEFANRILAFEKLGDRMGALNEITKTFNSQTREGKILLSQVFETQINVLEDLQRAKQRGIEIWPVSLEEARKYHDYWVDFEVKFGNIWRDISNHALKGLNEISKAFESEGTTTRGIADWLNTEMDQILSTIKSTIEEVKAIKAWWDNPNRGLPNLGEQKEDTGYKGRGDMDPMGEDYTRKGTLYGKVHEWMNKRSDAGTGTHPDITDFSGRRRDGEQTELLREVSDTLHRMEMKDEGGGGGTYGTGIRSEGGAMQGGLGGFRGLTSHGHGGGFRPGSSGAGGRRGAGAVGEAGPPAADLEGLKGSEFLQKQRASRIDEINKDPELKENVLKMLQLEEGSTTGKTGAMEALLNRSIMTGGTIKGELFSGFYGPINRGGLNKDLPAGARKTSQSAFDAAAGGSDLIKSRTDQGMVGDPNASGPGRIKVPGTSGIFNYWKGRRRGQDFSHETSRAWAEEQERQIGAGGEARAKMDKSQSSDDKWGKINASVEFLNVPPGVRTNADVDGGVFKDLQISKTKQSGVYRQPGQAYD